MNFKILLVTLITLVILWFGLSAFIDLISAIYLVLDNYIWAFFAGIIAFMISITLVGIMIQITIIVASILGVFVFWLIELKTGKIR